MEAVERRRKIRRAERGKLADFELFNAVVTVWLYANRRPKFPHDSHHEATEQVQSELMAEAAEAARLLSRKLLKAVSRGDVQMLRQTAATIEQARELPHSGERVAPFRREHYALLRYFTFHQTGTIAQLRDWMQKQMSWGNLDEKNVDKKIRRGCEDLGLTISPSAPGPKTKALSER